MGAFIARQPNGLLCRWSSVVDNITTKFNTKEECLSAVGSAMRNSEKPNGPIIIKELRETVITEVVNEEIL